jgi:transposase, IS30 family
VKLLHLPGRHCAEAVRDAVTRVAIELPEHARWTLIWDQGSEMALHDEPAHVFDDGIFFAHPGRPWQRGSNENTNGLIHQHLPKSADLARNTIEDLAEIEPRLNNRPRKTLGWLTPEQAFHAGLRS